MLRPLTLLALVSLTGAGCASLTPAGAPRCDGYDRRPLNRSLWAWADHAPSAAVPAPVDPASKPAPPLPRNAAAPERPAVLPRAQAGAEPVARPATIAVAAALQACGAAQAESGHG